MNEISPSGSAAARRRIRWGTALAALAVLAAYSNAFVNGFQFDDNSTIRDNAAIRDLGRWRDYFTDANTLTTAPGNAAYRPVATLSFALDYHWAGSADPRFFHLTQLLLHLLLAAILFGLFRSLLVRAGHAGPRRDGLALFGAAFFALHRVATEPLNEITLRSEIIAAVCAAAGLLLYLTRPRWRRSGLWLLPLVVGGLAKPTALMLAPLLAAYFAVWGPPDDDGADHGRRRASAAATLGAAFATAGGLYLLIRAQGGAHLGYGALRPGVYFLNQIYVWTHYLRLFIVPLGLSADPDLELIVRPYDTRVFLGAAVACGLLAGGWRWARANPRGGRLFLFGVLWYFIALVPSSSFFPLTNLENDYRLYFPMIGLILCVLATAGELLAKTHEPARRRLAFAGIALLAAHAAGVYERNRDWRSERTLWESVADAAPRSARAWPTLARIYLRSGELDKARLCIRRTDLLAPDTYLNAVNHAQLDLIEGREAAAGERLEAAARRWPEIPDAHAGYGEWLRRANRLDEAIAQFQTAVKLSPGDLLARRELVTLYAQAGRRADFCAAARLLLRSGDPGGLSGAVASQCPPGS